MNDIHASPDAARAHLVVLAPGLGGEALATGVAATAAFRDAAAGALPLHLDGPDPVRSILAALPAREMRDAGVDVDLRELVTRPGWRSDEQSVAMLGRRPLGPAAVTLLELRGVLLAAARSGCGTRAVGEARRQLVEHVSSAMATVQRGRPTALWLLALGDPMAVAHTIDVATLLPRLLGWPFGRELMIDARAHRTIVRSTNRRALDQLLDRLPRSPLAQARVEQHAPDGVLLLAPPGTAFGTRPLFARACHAHEGTAAVLVPTLPRTAQQLDLTGVTVRIAMAAMAATAAATTPTGPGASRRSRPAPVDADQLLPIADPQHLRQPGGRDDAATDAPALVTRREQDDGDDDDAPDGAGRRRPGRRPPFSDGS